MSRFSTQPERRLLFERRNASFLCGGFLSLLVVSKYLLLCLLRGLVRVLCALYHSVRSKDVTMASHAPATLETPNFHPIHLPQVTPVSVVSGSCSAMCRKDLIKSIFGGCVELKLIR